MRYIAFFLAATFVMVSHSGCTQNKNTSKPGNLIFKSNLRADGTSFYAMDNRTGQVYFMLDFGDNRGSWQAFGEKVKPGGPSTLLFDVVERATNASFYALDGMTGQLYYTNDDAASGGKWQKYGDIIRTNGVNLLQFEATGRFEGQSFYAFDSMSGQMYFMNDFGEGAGQWKTYGSPLAK